MIRITNAKALKSDFYFFLLFCNLLETKTFIFIVSHFLYGQQKFGLIGLQSFGTTGGINSYNDFLTAVAMLLYQDSLKFKFGALECPIPHLPSKECQGQQESAWEAPWYLNLFLTHQFKAAGHFYSQPSYRRSVAGFLKDS